ncbi:MAG TPA: DUF4214 domain-containing protein [Telluria sp.]|nr:DUF4214 domain-containing protein [Telluria sp.]
MKTSKMHLLACVCAGLLSACGGDSRDPATMPTRLAATTTTVTAAAVAADYNPVVQRVYVAYFGRPADPAGQAFFANNYLAAGAPTDIMGVSQAYFTNPAVRALVDAFGTSQESADLYPGENAVFVNAIYRNLFNREADLPGLNFWVNAINTGAMTRASAAVSIMAGSQGTDAQLIDKKLRVASDFTLALNTPERVAAYSGLEANAVVRAMLATVTNATDVNAFGPIIEATINQLVNGGNIYAQVHQIIQARCVGCHSANPTIPGYNPAPLGITLDTSEEIHAHAAEIYRVVVQLRYMPFGNITRMTEEERAVIANWYNQGAP